MSSIWKSHCKKKPSSCRCHKGNPNCVTFEFFPSVPWPYRNRFFRQSKTSTRTSRGVATDHEKEKTWISLISRNFLWKEILKQLKIFEKTHLNEFPASQMSQRMRKRKKKERKRKNVFESLYLKKQGESVRFLDINFTWKFFVGASWPRRWSASSDTRTSATARRKPSMASSRGRPDRWPAVLTVLMEERGGWDGIWTDICWRCFFFTATDCHQMCWVLESHVITTFSGKLSGCPGGHGHRLRKIIDLPTPRSGAFPQKAS